MYLGLAVGGYISAYYNINIVILQDYEHMHLFVCFQSYHKKVIRN